MKTYLLALLLFLTACNALKNKDKTKDKLQAETSQQVQNRENSTTTGSESYKIADSTVASFNQQSSTAVQSLIQSLSLKNTGKCTESGETAYMKFKDVSGAELSVPVNNNTDLSFSNSSELQQENSALKMENTSIKTQTAKLETELKASKETNTKLQTKLKAANTELSTQTKTPTFWSYLFWCLVAVVVYKVGEIYVKKLIAK